MGRHLVSFGVCTFIAALLVASAHAQCPEGKQPVTLVTPSGKVKTLCVPGSALEGIENAADHSSTTVVPSLCPKECLTPEEIGSYAASGTLACEEVSAQGSFFCSLHYADGTSVRVFLINADSADGSTICASATSPEGFFIKRDEVAACRAILEPYDVTSLAPCPCWSDADVAALSLEEGFRCEAGSDASYGSYVICSDTVFGKDLFVSSGSALCQNIAAKGDPVEGLTTAEVLACRTDLEAFLPPKDPVKVAQ